MDIAIIGSRSFTDYTLFCQQISYFVVPSDTIISGGAKGADSLAERFADEFEIDKKIIKPDWDKHGKKAGFLRNTQIVQQSDLVIAFWDGQSNGTRDSLKKARTLNKPYIVVLV